MKKYNYKEIYYNLEEINKLGLQGWRLVATKPNSLNIDGNAILEREVKEKPIKTTNLSNRKSLFNVRVGVYCDTYPKDMLMDFASYWTEHGENDRKMRFEKEKAFDIDRRLKTWYKRSNHYKNDKVQDLNRM
jgi:hypothetical protein